MVQAKLFHTSTWVLYVGGYRIELEIEQDADGFIVGVRVLSSMRIEL